MVRARESRIKRGIEGGSVGKEGGWAERGKSRVGTGVKRLEAVATAVAAAVAAAAAEGGKRGLCSLRMVEEG